MSGALDAPPAPGTRAHPRRESSAIDSDPRNRLPRDWREVPALPMVTVGGRPATPSRNLCPRRARTRLDVLAAHDLVTGRVHCQTQAVAWTHVGENSIFRSMQDDINLLITVN